ncbi:MAG TPA: dienelactone hydrolase family protein [Fimbriiglobus sp.]|jgi:dienelactone hydrolase|nr:dienelactone hydrolase family protein [Fimbriiglobus sp.]
MRALLSICLTAAFTLPVTAATKSKEVTYSHGGKMFKGHLYWDDAGPGKRPGVLVLHEWWGLDDYAKKRAEQLAGMGYVAFAADMYGEGKLAAHPDDAKKFAGEVRSNVENWRGRARAALDVLAKDEHTDPSKLAAIGYCFGGSTALQLAYTGADLDAVVTFHAALPTPTAEQAKAVKAQVLVCHGADDKFVPEESVKKLKETLDAASVKVRVEAYPGAVHSFTVPGADKHKLPGMAYNAEADKKSWASMKAVFDEAFGAKK